MRWSIVALLAVGLWVGRADAAVGDDMAVHATQASNTRLRADDLFSQVKPGRSFSTSENAVQRFQDLLYLQMIGEYERAAEGFFVLVTSGSLIDEGLHRDAEWYLAESLYELGNYDTAVSRFEVVASDKGHPFREDAVRRLLEIHSELGRLDDFDEVYQREVVRGGVRATDGIIYTVAKSFYTQGDYTKARANFEDLDDAGPYAGRGEYFLGVIDVVEGKLDAALAAFQRVVERSIDNDTDRQVHDLALVAMGRIHYELGRYTEAREAYERLSADSHVQADRLYELVWTDIRRGTELEDRSERSEAFHDALTGIEIFLIGYPEHKYAPSLRVIQGKLHMAEVEYDNALGVFEAVAAEYGPVRDRFAEMASATTDDDVFRQVEALSQAHDLAASGLPPYAVALAMADEELGRAVDLYRDVDRQEQNIEISEGLIRDITGALGEHTALGGLQQLRYDALVTSRAALRQQLDLLAAEETALRGLVAPGQVGQLDALARRRTQLEQQGSELERTETEARSALESWQLHVGRVKGEAVQTQHLADGHAAELDALRAELDAADSLDPNTRRAVLDDIGKLESDLAATRRRLVELEAELAGLTRPVGDYGSYAQSPAITDLQQAIEALRREQAQLRPPGVAFASTVDATHGDLAYTHRRIGEVHKALDALERSELERVIALFEKEVREVADERAELASLYGDATRVAAVLGRRGFSRLEATFAASVLDADLGIVDVYWAQRVEVAEEVERVKKERALLLQQLDERFDLIRSKLGN